MTPSVTSWPKRVGDEKSKYQPLEVESDKPCEYVYFLGSKDATRVKIGWSDKPDFKRLTTHSKGDAFGMGGDFELLAIVRAHGAIEKKVQSYFEHIRVKDAPRNEVFHATPELIDYIVWLRDQYFVSTDQAYFYTPQGLTTIDQQFWTPRPERREKRRSQEALPFDAWCFLPSRVVTGDDYYTPIPIVDCVRRALGGRINLDPASHVVAQMVVKADRFFTKDQNGLIESWSGAVFLNPPFSAWEEWVDKTLVELASGHISSMVALGANRTLSAKHFHPLLDRADAYCQIKGRFAFWGMDTKSESPTDGHFLLYFGQDRALFQSSVREIGCVFVKSGGAK